MVDIGSGGPNATISTLGGVSYSLEISDTNTLIEEVFIALLALEPGWLSLGTTII